MLIPRRSLLILVGGLLVPLAVAGGLRPEWVPAVGLAAAVLGIAALVDAVLGLQLAGTGLTFQFPEVVRLAKGREGSVAFVVGNTRPGTPLRRLRFGLALPEAVRTPDEELDAGLAPGVARTLFNWPVTGLRRGNHRARTHLL